MNLLILRKFLFLEGTNPLLKILIENIFVFIIIYFSLSVLKVVSDPVNEVRNIILS